MIIAYAEDGMIWAFEDEAAAKLECEPIDVESGVFVFYDEDGSWLKPVFVTPNRVSLFGLLLTQGEYRLERAQLEDGVDSINTVLAEAAGIQPNPFFASVAEVQAPIDSARARLNP